MSLFDHVPPSERAADLGLVVRRLLKRAERSSIPILVVEGRTDEPPLGVICEFGEAQVFSAGTRGLVEQLLVYLDGHPVHGCDCVFVVDCDANGKTSHLAARDDLVVTEACDLEADLVSLGVAERLAERHCEHANELVALAIATAMPVSRVRRAAHRVSVSMKQGHMQMPLAALDDATLTRWETAPPSDSEMVAAIGAVLGWSTEIQAHVLSELPNVGTTMQGTVLGKDVLDALHRLILDRGSGDAKGWTRQFFHKTVRAELRHEDFEQWEVGRRLARWAAAKGHRFTFMPGGSEP